MVREDEYLKEEIRRESEYDSISGYLETQKRIKKEVSRLRKLFKEIDENKKKLVVALIDDVAFLTVTMQDLRENIIREGTTVEYKNGPDRCMGANKVPMHSFTLRCHRNRRRQ